MVVAFGRAFVRSIRFYAFDVLTPLIVAYLKDIVQTLRQEATEVVFILTSNNNMDVFFLPYCYHTWYQ